jgi:hypothetical protein
MRLLLIALSIPALISAQQDETTALFRQEFTVQGATSNEFTDDQQLEFEQVIQSYLTGTTCDVVSQKAGEVESEEFMLQIEYECVFLGSKEFATSFFDFIGSRLTRVTDDLSNLGVVQSFAPLLLLLNGETATTVIAPLNSSNSTETSTEAPVDESPLAANTTVEPTASPVTESPPTSTAENATVSTWSSGFRQGFVVAGDTAQLTPEQQTLLGMQMDVYTQSALESNGVAAPPVTTQCLVYGQSFAQSDRGETLLVAESECTWTSSSAELDLSDVPRAYIVFVNDNLGTVTRDLQAIGLGMLEEAWPIQVFTAESQVPSAAPTETRSIETTMGMYAQRFILDPDAMDIRWSDEQLVDISAILAGYTLSIVDDATVPVDSSCEVNNQQVEQDGQDETVMNLRYTCTYTSVVRNLSTLFIENVNANLDQVSQDLQPFGVREALPVRDATAPTMAPTLFPASQFAMGSYTQEFALEAAGGGNEAPASALESDFVGIIQDYTQGFGEDGRTVSTECQIDDQWERIDPLGEVFLKVDYSCNYTALQDGVNVTEYPDLFVSFVNDNLVGMAQDLQNIDETINEALPVVRRDSSSSEDTTATISPLNSTEVPVDSNETTTVPSNTSTSMPGDETMAPNPEGNEAGPESPTPSPSIACSMPNDKMGKGSSAGSVEISSGRKYGMSLLLLVNLCWFLF